MSEPDRNGLFIGWSNKLPSRLGLFLIQVAAVLVAGLAGAAFAIGVTQDDPGDGAFRFDWGRQTITGVLQADPYPVLHVTESERYAAGHAIMLSGPGKRGVQDQARLLDGQLVIASGVMLTRGPLAMLQVRGGDQGLLPAEPATDPTAAPAAATPDPPAPVPLGRWRLTGEICDGKCYAGAMRPGQGLSHRACANLCLAGGVPPVFVATDTVDGQAFFLIGGPDGGPVTDAILDHTAMLVEVEGQIERRGDLLVFRIDPATLEVL